MKKSLENRSENLGNFCDSLGGLALVVRCAIGRNDTNLGGFINSRGESTISSRCCFFVRRFYRDSNFLAECLQFGVYCTVTSGASFCLADALECGFGIGHVVKSFGFRFEVAETLEQ